MNEKKFLFFKFHLNFTENPIPLPFLEFSMLVVRQNGYQNLYLFFLFQF